MAYFTQAGHGQSYSNGGEDRDAAPSHDTRESQLHPSDPRHIFGKPQPLNTQAPLEPQQPVNTQFQAAQSQSTGNLRIFAQQPTTPFQPGLTDQPQPQAQADAYVAPRVEPAPAVNYFAQPEPPQYNADGHDAYSGPGMEQGHRYDEYGFTPEPAGAGRAGLSKAFSVLGAVASLALVVGIGLWGYQLISRDVSGVPVVRAVEGPLRVQPENPGGRPADHQGLAVNAVAANGNVESPADRLTLAPPAVDLAEDDQPMQASLRVDAPQTAAPATSADLSEEAVAAYQGGEIDALVAQLTDGVEPLDNATLQGAEELSASAAPVIVQPEPIQPVTVAAVAPAPNQALLNAPGVRVSLRPAARPARFSPTRSTAPAPVSRSTQEVSPDSLPAGTRLAQLGAYESAEVARAEWDRISGRFGDYLEGKKRVIQRAESGGRTFYRLRAMGFADLSDARRFCSALVAGNADCIPVTTR
ncbi:SPOR domain-containing protein [Phaeobacter italicus]|uniref:SPOR domain-containing protein n=1 Tax=Phaeobacter italicus TaxID=481446 RepID=UPI0035197F47